MIFISSYYTISEASPFTTVIMIIIDIYLWLQVLLAAKEQGLDPDAVSAGAGIKALQSFATLYNIRIVHVSRPSYHPLVTHPFPPFHLSYHHHHPLFYHVINLVFTIVPSLFITHIIDYHHHYHQSSSYHVCICHNDIMI